MDPSLKQRRQERLQRLLIRLAGVLVWCLGLWTGLHSVPARAQRVKATPELVTKIVHHYESLAAGPGAMRAGGQQTGAEERAWAWLMAYAVRAEPSYLLEAASTIEPTAPAEAWMLYARYLRLRPDTFQRESIERKLRALMVRLSGDLRDDNHRELLITQQRLHAQQATARGALREAERCLAIAYALSEESAVLLSALAELQERQRLFAQEYVLLQRMLEHQALDPQLRTLTETRLSELTRAPRSLNEPYMGLSGGLLLGGRRLSYLPAASEGPFDSGCSYLADTQLRVYQSTRCPTYQQPLTPGFLLNVSAYPLAAVGPRLLRGLGWQLRVQALPAQNVCPRQGGSGECGRGHQVDLETGLVWEYRQRQTGEGLRLRLLAGYGYHLLRLPGSGKDTWSSLPAPSYQMLSVGAALLWPLPLALRFPSSVGLSVHYHAVLDLGELTAHPAAAYGPVGMGHGTRIELSPLRLRMYQGVVLVASGQFELFRVAFPAASRASAAATTAAARPMQRAMAGGMLDLLYGINLGLHYEF